MVESPTFGEPEPQGGGKQGAGGWRNGSYRPVFRHYCGGTSVRSCTPAVYRFVYGSSPPWCGFHCSESLSTPQPTPAPLGLRFIAELPKQPDLNGESHGFYLPKTHFRSCSLWWLHFLSGFISLQTVCFWHYPTEAIAISLWPSTQNLKCLA